MPIDPWKLLDKCRTEFVAIRKAGRNDLSPLITELDRALGVHEYLQEIEIEPDSTGKPVGPVKGSRPVRTNGH